MKNQLYQKNIIFIVGFIVLIIVFLSMTMFNQENNRVVKTETKNQEIASSLENPEESSDSKMTHTGQNNQESVNLDDETEVSEPKEIRIVAEEILYPDEYDFSEITYDMVYKIGKPIKFNALPLTKAKEGDTIELEFGGMNFESKVTSIKENYYTAEQTGEDLGSVTTFWLKGLLNPDLNTTSHNSMYGRITYDIHGVVVGKLSIRSRRGDYNIHLSNNVAYYLDNDEKIQEEYKRGYKID